MFNLVGKLCVALLLWMAIGVLVWIGQIVYVAAKLHKLDPSDWNRGLMDEFVERMTGGMFHAKDKTAREFNREIDNVTGSSFGRRAFLYFVKWPEEALPFLSQQSTTHTRH